LGFGISIETPSNRTPHNCGNTSTDKNEREEKLKSEYHDRGSANNENGPGQSKISIDNDHEISAQNATPTHRIEPLAHETIIKGKTTMISPKGKGKAGYTQDIGETDVGASRHREWLPQRAQMDEPVLGAPAIPLEIISNHLKQHCFSEWNIRILQRCDAKIFPATLRIEASIKDAYVIHG
jgi:hypothetical protein